MLLTTHNQEMTVKQATVLTNVLLWAAAIIAAAGLGAPTFLSLVLLPSLGAVSMLISGQARRGKQCDA
ncbi:MAG: hypothetical protein LH470_09990 [Lysobacter sp.]|nr:hypothetical protein [Lysobacter sp.]